MDFNFKGFYDEIIFDVDRSILKSYTGKQGDTKSRGIYVTIAQKNAAIEDLTGLSMRLFYEKPDKTRGFINGVVDGNKFRIDYTNQMYAVPGVVKAELRLMGADGEIITAKTFKILVDSSIADGSIISENERGILDRAFELAEDIIPRIELLDVELLENVQSHLDLLTEIVSDHEDDISGLGSDLTDHKEDQENPHKVTKTQVGLGNVDNIQQASKAEFEALQQELESHKNDYATFKDNTTLKVAKVEKELNDYQQTMQQLNPNQEAKQSASGYGIISLPPNAANGQFSGIELRASSVVNITPYNTNKWRRCNLADDGTVLAYYGDENYKEDGSNGQVMVEIHKGYFRTEFLDGETRYYLSEYPAAGFEVHPAFIRNGREIDKIYMSAYEGCIYDVSAGAYLLNDEQVADFTPVTGDKLCSIAGAKPCSGLTQELTLPNSRILAHNRGTGWELQDFWTISFIQLCLFVEYGTFDSQSAIGRGIVDKASGEGNEAEITGQTSSLGNATGMADGTNGLVSVSYHGIENLWGNIWTWVDGINILDNVPYVADHDFQSNKFDEHYESLGVTLSQENGYVEDFINIPGAFLPSAVGTNKIGDYYYQASGARVARVGGYWLNGSLAGVAYWNLYHWSGYRVRFIGARALYIPQN